MLTSCMSNPFRGVVLCSVTTPVGRVLVPARIVEMYFSICIYEMFLVPYIYAKLINK
jgi:hypothetical protein